jgi:hypothetical protein
LTPIELIKIQEQKKQQHLASYETGRDSARAGSGAARLLRRRWHPRTLPRALRSHLQRRWRIRAVLLRVRACVRACICTLRCASSSQAISLLVWRHVAQSASPTPRPEFGNTQSAQKYEDRWRGWKRGRKGSGVGWGRVSLNVMIRLFGRLHSGGANAASASRLARSCIVAFDLHAKYRFRVASLFVCRQVCHGEEDFCELPRIHFYTRSKNDIATVCHDDKEKSEIQKNIFLTRVIGHVG